MRRGALKCTRTTNGRQEWDSHDPGVLGNGNKERTRPNRGQEGKDRTHTRRPRRLRSLALDPVSAYTQSKEPKDSPPDDHQDRIRTATQHNAGRTAMVTMQTVPERKVHMNGPNGKPERTERGKASVRRLNHGVRVGSRAHCVCSDPFLWSSGSYVSGVGSAIGAYATLILRIVFRLVTGGRRH